MNRTKEITKKTTQKAVAKKPNIIRKIKNASININDAIYEVLSSVENVAHLNERPTTSYSKKKDTFGIYFSKDDLKNDAAVKDLKKPLTPRRWKRHYKWPTLCKDCKALHIGKCIRRNYVFLKHLSSLHSPINRDKMLNAAGEDEIKALLDATFIILKEDGFDLSKKQKGKLRPYISIFRRLLKTKNDDQVRSIVRNAEGAFLPFLLNPVLQKLEQDKEFMQALEAEDPFSEDSEDDSDAEDMSPDDSDYSNIYYSDDEELS